jgi:arsenate reductase
VSSFKIYHNPRCSKSRKALQILQDNNYDYEIILYLDIKLSSSLIADILKKLNLSPRDLLRKNELDSDNDIINFMIQFPKLIERPIVIKENKAVIGRPPERVKELL